MLFSKGKVFQKREEILSYMGTVKDEKVIHKSSVRSLIFFQTLRILVSCSHDKLIVQWCIDCDSQDCKKCPRVIKRKRRGFVEHLLKWNETSFLCACRLGGISSYSFSSEREEFSLKKDFRYDLRRPDSLKLFQGKYFVHMMKVDQNNFFAINRSKEILLLSYSKGYVVKKICDDSEVQKCTFHEHTKMKRSLTHPESRFYINVTLKRDENESIIIFKKYYVINCIDYKKDEICFSMYDDDFQRQSESFKLLNVLCIEVFLNRSGEEILVCGGRGSSNHGSEIHLYNASESSRKLCKILSCDRIMSSNCLYFTRGILFVGGRMTRRNVRRRMGGIIDVFNINEILEPQKTTTGENQKWIKNLNKKTISCCPTNLSPDFHYSQSPRYIHIKAITDIITISNHRRTDGKLTVATASDNGVIALVTITSSSFLSNLEEEVLIKKDLIQRIQFLRDQTILPMFDEERNNIYSLKIMKTDCIKIFKFLFV